MKKNRKKSALALAVAFALTAGCFPSAAMAADVQDDFAAELTEKFTDPDRDKQSYVRWWLPQASLTDEQLKTEIQQMYDSGFDGVELCMQTSEAPTEDYAYGSDMWSHKWKLMMNTLLDHGMSVSLTSGTNWATSNVPGLDPDSQEASQVIAMGETVVAPGESITQLPQPETMQNKGTFIGAYAYKITGNTSGTYRSGKPWVPANEYSGYTIDSESVIELTDVTEGANVFEQNINWTAPEGETGEGDEGKYYVVAYWQQGNYKVSDPSTETAYATNYFDKRGVEALKAFWEEHYLDDEELNAKIKDGDVMLFMDSIELNPDGGITWWTDSVREEFKKRKGYDILPYMYLIKGLPQVYAVFDVYMDPASGYNALDGDKDLNQKIINDWLDVLTQLYEENLLQPLKEWLNSVGITTRAQISYGRSFEITEPSAYVDYPEAENLNQYNQIDLLRLHTAGAKLQDKTLSTETGGTLSPYDTSMQLRLRSVYGEYAAGFQKVVWHIWSATDTYGTEETLWPGGMPGFAGMFDRYDDREPAYEDYDEFNAHIGRIQTLMQTGSSRTDIGFLHNNWNQGLNSEGGLEDDIHAMNNMLAHMGIFYRSTELQDNGYTYDYLSPDLLNMDTVSYNEETKTIEPAGYKALIMYQKWMDADGAKKVLEWAKKGLPVVIMECAAKETPFNDGRDEELAATIEELKALDNVKTAVINDADEDFDYFQAVDQGYDDNVYDCLQELGVDPYVGFEEANHQILTQTREDEDGVKYLYAYNYCSNDYHENSHIDSVKTEDHGTEISTRLVVDGEYVPYEIDAWSGETTKIAEYEIKDGKTYVPVTLKYDDPKLYAFAPEEDSLHATDTTADAVVEKDGKLYAKAFASGDYTATLSDGSEVSVSAQVPDAYDITDWDLEVTSWTQGENLVVDEETIDDVTTVNSHYETDKTPINVKLDTMTTWDNIPEVGDTISGNGVYKATFNWDASAADGAVLDLGDELVSTMKVWINGQKVGGDISTNPTKAKLSIVEDQEGKDQYTGGINWKVPKTDISKYLVDGENTIEIHYNSTMGNALLATGQIEPTQSSWWGYDEGVEAYGPQKAAILPYALAALTE